MRKSSEMIIDHNKAIIGIHFSIVIIISLSIIIIIILCFNLYSSRVRCSQYSVLPSCDKSCDKMLDCGLHKCILICHEGMLVTSHVSIM